MNSSEYKKFHESFMQNNHGSNAVHTFCCIFITVQCAIISGLRQKKSGTIQYVYEYLYIVLPMIAAHTFLSDYIYHLNFVALLITIIELFTQEINSSTTLNNLNIFKTKVKSISCLRALTYLITVFSILAVDFRDYPRHLAKTENYGYSLMDTGVGLFALMSGLVHKDVKNQSFTSIIRGNIKFITVLVFLGFTRIVFIKQLDYQEHVTEYGVHWNFFFTLAVCKLLSTLLLYLSNRPFLFSIITIFIHELALHNGLQDWVFSKLPRDNLVSANREGLCSSLGYVSLYLFAVYIKMIICDKTVLRKTVLYKLIIGAATLTILTFLINFLRPASRTLANASYCIFLETNLCIVLALLYYLEVLSQNNDTKFHFNTPLILENINLNGLSYFLISNLMTGAINMSIRTLLVPSFVTFIILNAYMVLNIAFTVFMKKKGFRL